MATWALERGTLERHLVAWAEDGPAAPPGRCRSPGRWCWSSPTTRPPAGGERVRGPRWVEASHGLDTMPLYLREGAVIPMGPDLRWVGERPNDPLTLFVELRA